MRGVSAEHVGRADDYQAEEVHGVVTMSGVVHEAFELHKDIALANPLVDDLKFLMRKLFSLNELHDVACIERDDHAFVLKDVLVRRV